MGKHVSTCSKSGHAAEIATCSYYADKESEKFVTQIRCKPPSFLYKHKHAANRLSQSLPTASLFLFLPRLHPEVSLVVKLKRTGLGGKTITKRGIVSLGMFSFCCLASPKAHLCRAVLSLTSSRGFYSCFAWDFHGS